jgi:hypothetical protein
MSKAPDWTERRSDTFTTPGPRAGMTIELCRSKDRPSSWEGRFAFAIARGVVTKTFEAPDAESAQRLAWAAAEEWVGGR